MRELTLQPIGYIHTPFDDRYDAPRQPGLGIAREGIIMLEQGMNFEQALTDLAGFERIWLLYWFDRNANWKPMVLTPRSGSTKHGLFSTRSPHRPNPIGMSVVDLLEVSGRKIRVGNVDLLDGTPILDVKPYLPYADSYPESRIGWVEELDQKPGYSVSWSEGAQHQASWLKSEFGIDLIQRANEVLSDDPLPHPYRRITAQGGCFALAIRSWRLDFEITSETLEVRVIAVRSGYSAPINGIMIEDVLHDREAHLAFHMKWSGEGLDLTM